MELIRQDIEAKGLNEGILLDRNEWRKLIHVPDPAKFSFGSCSLPQILGTNGLVVVVVVHNLSGMFHYWSFMQSFLFLLYHPFPFILIHFAYFQTVNYHFFILSHGLSWSFVRMVLIFLRNFHLSLVEAEWWILSLIWKQGCELGIELSRLDFIAMQIAKVIIIYSKVTSLYSVHPLCFNIYPRLTDLPTSVVTPQVYIFFPRSLS